MKIFWVFILSIFSSSLSYGQYDNYAQILEDFGTKWNLGSKEIVSFYNYAMEHLPPQENDSTGILDYFVNFYVPTPEEKLYYLDRAISTFSINKPNYYFICQFEKAKLLLSEGRIEEAKKIYFLILEMDTSPSRRITVIDQLGYYNQVNKDLEVALDFYNMGLDEHVDLDSSDLAKMYHKVGQTYEQYIDSASWINSIYAINQALDYATDSSLISKCFYSLGNTYKSLHELDHYQYAGYLDSAYSFYILADKFSKPKSEVSSLVPLQKAKIWIKKGNATESIDILENSSEVKWDKTYQSKTFLEWYKAMAQVNKNKTQSIYHLLKSLEYLGVENGKIELLNPQKLYNNSLAPYLLNDLVKAYSDNKETDELSNAPKIILALAKMDECINFDLKNSLEESKLRRREEVKNFYQTAIEKCIGLKEYQLAFYYAEKSKAYYALDLANRVKSRGFGSNQVDSFAYKERRMYKLENFIESESGLKLPSDSTELLNKEISYLKGILMTSSDRDTLPTVVNLEALHSKLSSEEVIINYAEIDGGWVIFKIDNNSLETFTIPNVNVEAEVEHFLQTIQDKKRSDYITSATLLFEQLVKPFWEGGKRYIIIPDGILSNLPFELLLTSETQEANYKNLAYLIKSNSISYGFSASFWENMGSSKREGKSFLGFAPKFGTGGLKSLKYNAQEVKNLKSLFTGSFFIGGKSNKAKFLEMAPKSNFIHLATHAVINLNDHLKSKIYFGDGAENELSIKDLYNIKFPSSSIFLSACETAVGKLSKGEGSLSLARGFAIAGAKTLTSTLWQVNDRSTSYLVKNYYQNLSAGMPADQSLQAAKLDYLQSTDPAESAPFYWGGFVLSGDVTPVTMPKSSNLLLYLFITLGIILLVVSRRKLIHKKANNF